ncbi:hypothetical protein Q1695_015083 [Nippostrongylus brasiliensis]|nr:hypothetical protein Q1695_015083 [Nippostrongylus brasiliensis]
MLDTVLLCSCLALMAIAHAKTFNNQSMLFIPGMETMASDKYPHYTVVETVSRTKFHRHRREVIAGPIYDWNSYEIPYQIWGGDCEFIYCASLLHVTFPFYCYLKLLKSVCTMAPAFFIHKYFMTIAVKWT